MKLVSLLFAACMSTIAQAAADDLRTVIGAVENVGLDDANVVMKARVDTGAELASVDATILSVEKDADGTGEHVVFSVKDVAGKPHTLKRRLVQWVKIKGRKDENVLIRRPVIKLDFCIAGHRIEARANLTDRSGFTYPILIGRNVMKVGNFLVDPQATFLQKPTCP